MQKSFSTVCWNCGRTVLFDLNPSPEITEIECYACGRDLGNVIWAEMDPGVWIPMPNLITKEGEDEKGFKIYQKKKISNSLRWDIWERDNFTCKHCGSRKDLSVDHIIPESKGGTLDKENLQTLCKSCNSKKGAR